MKKVFYISLLMAILTSCSQEKMTYKQSESEVEFSIDGIKKRITFFAPNLVRISKVKEQAAFKDSSLVVLLPPKSINFSVTENDFLTIKTDSLTLKIDKNNGAVQFFNNREHLLLKEHSKELASIRDTTIQNKSYFKIKQGFELTQDEGIYGLGQFQDDLMNYRGQHIELVQANRIAIVPHLVSTNNYGILWDNYSHSTFRDGNDGAFFTSEVADQIDYYFIGGGNMDDVVSGYRTLTGKAPMFSKKAYGYWQSKERYKSFDELHEVIKKYRENNIPIDNIVQDWRYWGGNKQWSSMYFEPEFFSNPKENIDKLHAENVDLMVSIWPTLGAETQIYKDMEAKGYLLKPKTWSGGKVYDAYHPDARDIYWKHIKKGLAEQGVDAYWMDGTEPELSNSQTQKIIKKTLLEAESVNAGPIAKFLNAYALVTSENIYQRHREFTNDKRVFILTRSSWAGQQRNATLTWSGDIAATYKTLKTQISAGINFCMTGIPYWTHDIGAFFPSGHGGLYPKGIEDPAYRELYVRWFQFGAFTPIFRSHGTGTPREVWQFKDRDPELYNSLKKTTELRYQLLPYIYSNAWQVTKNDYTLMRGLAMDFSQDKNTYNIGDQYMFGASFMVKPITKCMYYEAERMPDIIPSENLRSLENTHGLSATYFKDVNFKQSVHKQVDEEIDFNWSGGGLPVGVPEENFSVRWEGSLIATENGLHRIASIADNGCKVWINNKLVINSWNRRYKNTLNSCKIELEKGKEYPIKVDFFLRRGGAKISLAWETPSNKVETVIITKDEKVYLPEYIGWYDYWTNKFYKGGQTITEEFPIDIFPLFVKAGSIVPFSPVQQYVGEKPNSPIELRVYAGSNATFTLYEDEGNNYNYEQGAYNEIELLWNEENRTLTIGESEGNFVGFKKEKVFHITVVDPENNGAEKTESNYNECQYDGSSKEISFK